MIVVVVSGQISYMKQTVLTVSFTGYTNSPEFEKKIKDVIRGIRNEKDGTLTYENIYLFCEKGNYTIKVHLSKISIKHELLKLWKFEISKRVLQFSKANLNITINDCELI